MAQLICGTKQIFAVSKSPPAPPNRAANATHGRGAIVAFKFEQRRSNAVVFHTHACDTDAICEYRLRIIRVMLCTHPILTRTRSARDLRVCAQRRRRKTNKGARFAWYHYYCYYYYYYTQQDKWFVWCSCYCNVITPYCIHLYIILRVGVMTIYVYTDTAYIRGFNAWRPPPRRRKRDTPRSRHYNSVGFIFFLSTRSTTICERVFFPPRTEFRSGE